MNAARLNALARFVGGLPDNFQVGMDGGRFVLSTLTVGELREMIAATRNIKDQENAEDLVGAIWALMELVPHDEEHADPAPKDVCTEGACGCGRNQRIAKIITKVGLDPEVIPEPKAVS